MMPKTTSGNVGSVERAMIAAAVEWQRDTVADSCEVVQLEDWIVQGLRGREGEGRLTVPQSALRPEKSASGTWFQFGCRPIACNLTGQGLKDGAA